MISIILGSGGLPANLASAISTTSIFRVPLSHGSAIRKVIQNEVRSAEKVLVTFSVENTPPEWLALASDKVEWVEVPQTAQVRSIGASVLTALDSLYSSLPDYDQDIRVVYGDTLSDLSGSDMVAVGHSSEPEDWSYAPESLSLSPINSRASDSEPRIITGLFSFENGRLFYDLLKGEIEEASTKRGAEPFFSAILAYAKTHPKSLKFELDSEWQDFGHLTTYMSARKSSLQGRMVNSFMAPERSLFVTKQSSRTQKLRNEASWFRDVPDELFRFLPRVIIPPNLENYRVQYIPAITLSEKLLYGENHLIDWSFIFDSLEGWLDESSSFVAPEGGGSGWKPDSNWLRQAFEERVIEILKEKDLDQRIAAELKQKRSIVNQALDFVSRRIQTEPFCVVHGDLILSNILVAERDKLFKLIDPRGGFSHPSIYGPAIYEWAKLAQSVFGRYEEILAGEYFWDDEESRAGVNFFEDPERSGNYKTIQDWFEDACPYPGEAKCLAGLLLVSAIPFHFEDPERALAMFRRGFELIETK